MYKLRSRLFDSNPGAKHAQVHDYSKKKKKRFSAYIHSTQLHVLLYYPYR